MTEQMEMEFEIGGSVLGIYQKADYDAWIAVGEWVDNAVQSYKENKKTLQKILKDEDANCLEVKIVYEIGKKLVIRDNAAGMSEEELRLAFKMGKDKNRKKDDLGQNNAGMKSAALWLGEKWEIKTKRFDSKIEYTTNVDAKKLFNDDFKLPLKQKTVNDNSHYTQITITEILPKRKWGASQQTKIKKYLSSMYKFFIQDGDLELSWNNNPIEPRDLSIRKDQEGKEYKYPFEAKKSDMGKEDYLHIKGYFAVLFPDEDLKDAGLPARSGSGRMNSGISIFRRNRMIMGYPDPWKPDDVFGEGGTNDLFNQRVFAEIHVDDSDVSQDKSAIAGPDLRIIEKFLAKKKEELKLNKLVNGFKRSNKPPTQDEIDDAKKGVIKELEDSNLDLSINDDVPDQKILEGEIKGIDQIKDESTKEVVKVGVYTINMYFQPLGEAKKYFSMNPSSKNDSKTIDIIINLDHPYLKNVLHPKQYFLDCVMDAIAVWKGKEISREDSEAFVHIKDNQMKIGFDDS